MGNVIYVRNAEFNSTRDNQTEIVQQILEVLYSWSPDRFLGHFAGIFDHRSSYNTTIFISGRSYDVGRNNLCLYISLPHSANYWVKCCSWNLCRNRF